MNTLQVAAVATPDETAQGRAPIALRVLFVLIGVAGLVFAPVYHRLLHRFHVDERL